MASYAAADRIGHALPQPTPELLQGFDTATQITALAHWLRHQPSPRSALGSPGKCQNPGRLVKAAQDFVAGSEPAPVPGAALRPVAS